MADPFVAASVISAAFALGAQSGKVVISLKTLASKYKFSEVEILAMSNQCETLKLAWDRIRKWCELHQENINADQLLMKRVSEDLELGSAIMSTLEEDVSSILQAPRPVFWHRTKIVWNGKLLQDHQARLDRHVTCTMLLLQTTLLPTPDQRNIFLWEKEQQNDESQESAWTIIQSHSGSISGSHLSRASEESLPLSYRTLAFDEELFNGRVYQRNGWNVTVARLLKRKPHIRSPAETSKGRDHRKNCMESTQTAGQFDQFQTRAMSRAQCAGYLVGCLLVGNCLLGKSIYVHQKTFLGKELTAVIVDGMDHCVDPRTGDLSLFPIKHSQTALQRPIPSYDAEQSLWLIDLVGSCRTAKKERLKKLLSGRHLFNQPKDSWHLSGCEAFKAGVSHNKPKIVRILLDHCVFNDSVVDPKFIFLLQNESWIPDTEFGSNEEFFCDLLQIAESLGNEAVLKELTRLQVVRRLFVTRKFLSREGTLSIAI